MGRTFRSKILFYFLVVSLCGILLSSSFVLWGFEDHFTNYLQENREKNIGMVKEEISREYKESGKLVKEQLFGLLHQHAMTGNLYYQIYSEKGEKLIDTTMMLEMHGMGGETEREDYRSASYELEFDDRLVGQMKVYYPNIIINEDFSFLEKIKQNIYIAALITIILSFIFSMLFSKKLSKGLNQLSKAVQELQEHNWHTKVPVEELTEEIKPLGHSFNELARSLAKEESLRKRFTADLAHELRTPLATLRSQIEAYLDGIWDPTEERLEQSHKELMRLVRLVNEMEKLLAVENPQLQLEKTEIEADKILSRMESQFLSAFSEKGVHLKIIKPNKEYWFKADQDRVIQILTNIINNALQYTPAGKNVELSILEKEKFIGFAVKDEGTGIQEQDLPYLYERFYRGDKSRARGTGGIGIGLSIVKALVDAHEGKLEIKSKPNIGTTIMVLFPKK